jgi:hypothetical protein
VIYVFPITIPANTPESAPVIQTLQLSRGRITQMHVQFPSGHLGLTHIGLSHGLHQLYPSNPEARFSSSGETVMWAEDELLSTPPYTLEARAWNEDDTYPHTITVRVVFETVAEQTSLVSEIAELLGLGGGE